MICIIKLRVRYAETDKMGVVYHTRYFEWFEMGRTELIRISGLSYKYLEENNISLPVVEMKANYYKPALYDDIITIETWMEQTPSARVKIEYKAKRDEEILAIGYTLHTFIDKNFKIIKPPRDLIDKLRRLKELPGFQNINYIGE